MTEAELPLQAGQSRHAEEMRQTDRDAWNTVELRLADRDRELREQSG